METDLVKYSKKRKLFLLLGLTFVILAITLLIVGTLLYTSYLTTIMRDNDYYNAKTSRIIFSNLPTDLCFFIIFSIVLLGLSFVLFITGITLLLIRSLQMDRLLKEDHEKQFKINNESKQ